MSLDFVVVDRDTAITLTLVPRAQMLDTMRVRGSTMAIHGVIGASRDLRPLAGATVLVVGAGRSETTDSTDSSSRRSQSRARTSFVARPGYAMPMIIIDVQADKSVETSALFDSSEISVRPGTDELWAEFDKRVVWHAMNSAVVSGADLRQFEANLLSDALRSTVPVDNIEAIEIYAAFSDPTESLRKSWPRGVPCGEADGLRSSGRAAPATAIYAVIWMKH